MRQRSLLVTLMVSTLPPALWVALSKPLLELSACSRVTSCEENTASTSARYWPMRLILPLPLMMKLFSNAERLFWGKLASGYSDVVVFCLSSSARSALCPPIGLNDQASISRIGQTLSIRSAKHPRSVLTSVWLLERISRTLRRVSDIFRSFHAYY